jgi:hypothetical protein
MPRTPAPLTAPTFNDISQRWEVWHAGNWCGFDSEADARAFVALPALIDALVLARFVSGDSAIREAITAALTAAQEEA